MTVIDISIHSVGVGGRAYVNTCLDTRVRVWVSLFRRILPCCLIQCLLLNLEVSH